MASVNRAQLRTLVRVLANQRPAGAQAFIVDSDAAANATSLDTLINLRLASLYDLLVVARGHEYYAADAAVAISPSRSRKPASYREIRSFMSDGIGTR